MTVHEFWKMVLAETYSLHLLKFIFIINPRKWLYTANSLDISGWDWCYVWHPYEEFLSYRIINCNFTYLQLAHSGKKKTFVFLTLIKFKLFCLYFIWNIFCNDKHKFWTIAFKKNKNINNFNGLSHQVFKLKILKNSRR